MATADPAPKLVELGETEPFSLLNDHDAGGWHIDSHLNHSRRDENGQIPSHETRHHGILFGGRQLAVYNPNPLAKALG